jgi:hypothetical protein
MHGFENYSKFNVTYTERGRQVPEKLNPIIFLSW